jgi:hypothetical protein
MTISIDAECSYGGWKASANIYLILSVDSGSEV